MKNVVIYSDGSCLGNPGPGGWASILTFGEHEKMLSGGKDKTTNNHMELMGVIQALKALKMPCNVTVVTDSQYVVNAFNNGWVYNWEKKNNFAGRPNEELWREIMPLVRTHKVTFNWIKGHAGHSYNERCDKEAVRQSKMHKYSMKNVDETPKNSDEDIYPWMYDGPIY